MLATCQLALTLGKSRESWNLCQRSSRDGAVSLGCGLRQPWATLLFQLLLCFVRFNLGSLERLGEEVDWAVCNTTEMTYVFFTTLVRDQEVAGSNPFAPTPQVRSGPDTWVTHR